MYKAFSKGFASLFCSKRFCSKRTLKTTTAAALLTTMLSSAAFISPSATAQITTTPSAAQIEQFKKLPRSQQEALAKQFGIDINSFGNLDGNQNNQQTQPAPEQQYVNDTGSDAFGAALLKKSNKVDKNNLNELKPFGYDMFKDMQTSFIPGESTAVPADYIVGPGDSLEIALYGKESSTEQVTIDNEGKITFAELQPLTVAGLTYQEVKQRIADVIEVSMIGIKSSVSIAGLRSIQVYVVGDVQKPGAYQLSSLSTMTNAIFISGGPTEVGSLRDIQLKRAGKHVSTLDLYKLFTQGDVTSDQRLQQGDVVFVNSVQSQVKIYGEVRRPAIYEVKSSDDIRSAIKLAGGLTSLAYPKNVLVTTLDENYQRAVKRIDLTDKRQQAKNRHALKAGDVVRVLPISQQFSKVVHVGGAVSRPSSHAFYEGMNLSDLISSGDDLTQSTDMSYALVVSEDETGSISIQHFAPKAVLSGSQVDLNANDLVLFFNRYDEAEFLANNLNDVKNIQAELREVKNLSTNEKINLANEANTQSIDAFKKQWLAKRKKAITENEGFNYIYELKTGNFQAQQDALLQTKTLTRQELVLPIIKLIEANVLPGQYVPTAEINGQVNFPGVYPISKNATVLELVAAAGGVQESANLEVGEISRTQFNSADAEKTHIRFSLKNALNGDDSQNLQVAPKDVVNVFQQANWQKESKITLTGEVVFPGTYTIREGEGLADVIKRAGGLTKFASAEAAFFTRESLKELEQKQARDLARNLSKELAFKSISSSYANIAVGEVQTLVDQLTTVEGVGRLVIDLDKVMDTSNQYDIQLENGDSLMVPTYRREVNVIGEVQVATSHIYNDSWNLDDYLRSSGGLRQQADGDRVYIIRANGLVDIPDYSWLGGNDTVVHPGDTVVVPLDANYTDKLTLWEKSTSIFYQLTVGLAALGRL